MIQSIRCSILFVFLCVLNDITVAQELNIESGTQVVVSGAAEIVIEDAKFINNGSFEAGTGKVTIEGSAASSNTTIDGTSTTQFYDLTINKSSNNVLLKSNIEVEGSIELSAGNFDLEDNNMDLGTTGSITGEDNSKRIISTNDGSSEGSNTGTITATRNIPSGSDYDFAGLGLTINSTSYTGNKTITRGHKTQSGTGSYSGNTSVARYYLLPDIGMLSNTNKVEFKYLSGEVTTNDDTNTDDAYIKIFQKVRQNGNEYFTPVYTDVTTISGNTPGIAASQDMPVPYMAYTNNHSDQISFLEMFTFGGDETDSGPLPIELVNFSAECNYPQIVLKWTTQSETNNDYFILEKSSDGINFTSVAVIPGAGNSSITQNYSYTDNINTADLYYRLKQVDYSGEYSYSDIINPDCKTQTDSHFSEISFSERENEYIITFNSSVSNNYNILLIDNTGKQLLNDKITIEPPLDKYIISKNKYAIGLYNLIVYNQFHKESFVLSIIKK